MMDTKGLGQKISWVIFSNNMYQAYHTCSYSFPNPIIDNIVVTIIKGVRATGETGHCKIFVSHHLG